MLCIYDIYHFTESQVSLARMDRKGSADKKVHLAHADLGGIQVHLDPKDPKVHLAQTARELLV